MLYTTNVVLINTEKWFVSSEPEQRTDLVLKFQKSEFMKSKHNERPGKKLEDVKVRANQSLFKMVQIN